MTPPIEDRATQPRGSMAAFAAPGAGVRVPPAQQERRRTRKLLPLVLVLLALLLGLGMGMGFWSYMASHTASTNPSSAHQATAATATPVSSTPTHAAQPTATPTAHASPTATTATGGYPAVAGTYNGTANNTTADISAPMSLSIRQSGSTISGYFTVSLPLQGSNNFTGNVTTGRSIHFTVRGTNGYAPLLFSGSVQSNNSMSGQYCSIDAAGQCSASAGGAGNWNVTPTSSAGS